MTKAHSYFQNIAILSPFWKKINIPFVTNIGFELYFGDQAILDQFSIDMNETMGVYVHVNKYEVTPCFCFK